MNNLSQEQSQIVENDFKDGSEDRFWQQHIACKDEPESVRVDGEHFRINFDERTAWKGFGGRKWQIKFKDGREVVTTNLWYQGIIPEHLRDQLPDNAEFVGSSASMRRSE